MKDETRGAQTEPASEVTVTFPEGRSRFNTEETIEILGIPRGSKPYFLQLVIDAQVPCEKIGKSRTYDREAIMALARLNAERRGSSKLQAATTLTTRLRRGRRGRPRRSRPSTVTT